VAGRIQKRRPPFSLWSARYVFVCLFFSALTACETAPDLPNPAPGFARAGLPGDWIPDPKTERDGISFMEKEGIAALKISPTKTRAFAGRRLEASLIGSPYLRWAWYLETPSRDETGQHLSDATAPPRNPLRLRVAFRGGHGEEGSKPVSPWRASGVPSHDRLLDLVWEWGLADTTQGGAWRPVEPPAAEPRSPEKTWLHPGCTVPCIAIRKNLTDSGRWWLETADLEKIYRRFWPEDRFTEVRIVFVALILESAPTPMAGYLADLDLRR